ncbi:MAG: hypothetical protein V7607_6337 [Solirubrobacteraceae bacterium]
MIAVRVNTRWLVKSAASRDEVLAAVRSGFADSDITFAVSDGDLGALGLPLWTVVIFSATHGDFARLTSDVAARVAALGLADRLAELTLESSFQS